MASPTLPTNTDPTPVLALVIAVVAAVVVIVVGSRGGGNGSVGGRALRGGAGAGGGHVAYWLLYNASRNTCLAKRLARCGDFPTLYVDPYTN
jgi:hypothetical protein